LVWIDSGRDRRTDVDKLATDHLHWELEAEAGDTIEVSLDRAANVQLLDRPNYENYLNRQPYSRLEGGYTTFSPVEFDVPTDGVWHLVIDLGGGPGQVRAVPTVISKASIV